MRKVSLTALFLVTLISLSFAATPTIPESLRGDIKASQETIAEALIMQQQGWEYVMPQPKSKQAQWGNSDGRTTWWVGHWKNSKTKHTSSKTPSLKDSIFVGDKIGRAHV